MEKRVVRGLKTARGQLAIASEFRFDYWHTEHEHRYYAVCRGVGNLEHRWAICDGDRRGAKWDGAEFQDSLYKKDAYRYELEPALDLARQLAFEENQRLVALMEVKLPGRIRGSRFDQSTWKEEE